MPEKSKYCCCICDKQIAKYGLDLGDTVNLKSKLVCDECSYEIAEQRISR